MKILRNHLFGVFILTFVGISAINEKCLQTPAYIGRSSAINASRTITASQISDVFGFYLRLTEDEQSVSKWLEQLSDVLQQLHEAYGALVDPLIGMNVDASKTIHDLLDANINLKNANPEYPRIDKFFHCFMQFIIPTDTFTELAKFNYFKLVKANKSIIGKILNRGRIHRVARTFRSDDIFVITPSTRTRLDRLTEEAFKSTKKEVNAIKNLIAAIRIDLKQVNSLLDAVISNVLLFVEHAVKDQLTFGKILNDINSLVKASAQKLWFDNVYKRVQAIRDHLDKLCDIHEKLPIDVDNLLPYSDDKHPINICDHIKLKRIQKQFKEAIGFIEMFIPKLNGLINLPAINLMKKLMVLNGGLHNAFEHDISWVTMKSLNYFRSLLDLDKSIKDVERNDEHLKRYLDKFQEFTMKLNAEDMTTGYLNVNQFLYSHIGSINGKELSGSLREKLTAACNIVDGVNNGIKEHILSIKEDLNEETKRSAQISIKIIELGDIVRDKSTLIRSIKVNAIMREIKMELKDGLDALDEIFKRVKPTMEKIADLLRDRRTIQENLLEEIAEFWQ